MFYVPQNMGPGRVFIFQDRLTRSAIIVNAKKIACRGSRPFEVNITVTQIILISNYASTVFSSFANSSTGIQEQNKLRSP